MKKPTIIITAVILLAAATVFGQESDVVYIEGWVDIKDSSGETYELFIGDRVYSGDTVITADDGLAELEPENGSRIIVKPGTVFNISERDIDGKKQSVVSTTLGQVSFKFNRMTKEPLISTPSTVMGVRGTEFTVYAGADGSSLVTVESGAVEVSGQGEKVLLEQAEGVEVRAGMAPGEKFEVLGKAVDYSDWNNSRIESMIKNPAKALSDLSEQIQTLITEMEKYTELYNQVQEDIPILRERMNTLFEDGKDDEAQALYKDQLRPLEITSLRHVMNYRYYALSILSMRQHVLSGFYIKMKTAYITDSENVVYQDFLKDYYSLIDNYQKRVTPYLVEADY